MIIDCGRCDQRSSACDERPRACGGCLISALWDTPDGIGDLTSVELGAIETLELAGFDVQLLETPAAPAMPVRLVPSQRQVA
jgi:hypothetical protein